MSSLFVAVVLLFTILYLSLIFHSTALALLSISIVVFVVLSLIYIIHVKRRISISIDIPTPVVETGQKFSLILVVEKKTALPIRNLGVTLTLGGSEEKKARSREVYIDDITKKKTRHRIELSIDSAGSYACAINKAKVHAPWGFIFLKKKLSGSKEIIVIPQAHALAIVAGEGIRHFFGDSDVIDEFRAGPDPTEVFDIREFRNGDKLPRIHWKLSAKADELMVKEDAEPKACPVVLYCGYDEGNTGRLMEWIASISFTLMDMDIPHFVTWMSKSRKEIVRTRVDDEESYYNFLVVFIQDVDMKAAGDLETLYKEKYKNERVLYALKLLRYKEISLGDNKLNTSSFEDFELVLK